MFNRDIILKDMKDSVMEIFFKDVDGHKISSLRCTHRPDLLPKTFVNEQHLMEDFHNQNPNHIATWNVIHRTWSTFDISNVQYTQVVDNY
jgi:hypothetical protein